MMSFFKSFLIPGFFVLASTVVHADISVENNSEFPIRVSFLGDGCRLFDSDRYNYAPCEEKEIAVNTTASFTNIIEDISHLSRKDRAIVPRILFSSFGFSYICRVELFYLTQLCDLAAGKNIPYCRAHLLPTPGVNDSIEDIPKSAPLTLRGATLSVDTNYSLIILSGYGYFPQPYVLCELSVVKSHCKTHCEP